MTVIYIVTAGEYSDYYIHSVYSTQELAERYVRDNGGNIEEFEIDKPSNLTCVSRVTYFAELLLDGGEITHMWKGSKVTQPSQRGGSAITSRGWFKNTPEPTYSRGWSYISQEHAVKLAIERRQRWLAERARAI